MTQLLAKHNNNSIGLIGHTVIDYPSPKKARQIIEVMIDAGVSLIELQIPFSDPVADGPLFVEANQQALAHHVDVAQCFAFMQDMTSQYSIPFVFMTYANIVFKKGFAEFVKHAVAVGAKGAIIADLPIEASTDYLKACQQQHFSAIQIIPPNVDESRLSALVSQSQGFVYVVSRSGVTGSKTQFGAEISQFVPRVRSHTDLPIAVGFGVSSADDIEFLKPIADYAIVGTQTLRTYQQHRLAGVQRLWQALASAAGAA